MEGWDVSIMYGSACRAFLSNVAVCEEVSGRW
jgi:hypothetical protein